MQREAIMICSRRVAWPPAPNPHDTTQSFVRSMANRWRPDRPLPAYLLVSLEFRSRRREGALLIWSVSYRGHDWLSWFFIIHSVA
jgi:hypothetical protein